MKSSFSTNQLLKGLVLAGVMVVALLAVISITANKKIISSQQNMAEIVMPLEQAAKVTETAVWHYIASRNRLQSAATRDDLAVIKERNDAASQYEEHDATLQELAGKIPEIANVVAELHDAFTIFQRTYSDVYVAVGVGIELNEKIESKIQELDSLNEKFQKNTEAIAGKVNFASMRKKFAIKKLLKQKNKSTEINTAINDYLQGDLDNAQKSCTALIRAASSLAAYGRSLLLADNSDSLNSIKSNQIQQALQAIDSSLKVLTSSSVLTDGQKKMVQELSVTFSTLQDVLVGEEDSIFFLRSNWFVEQIKIQEILATSKDSTVVILTKLANLSETGEEIYDEAEDKIATVSQTASFIIIGAGALAAIAMVLAGIYIIRKVVGPLERAIDVANYLSQGDLTVTVDSESKDELLVSMKIMVDNIADIVRTSSGIASTLATSSSKQAASIEETSAAVAEISSMTTQNLDETTIADKQVKEINQLMVSAGTSMENMTSAMLDISEASSNTQKIIKSIDEIAFQTNLLALNAAVEAARAGEAGAGFAVVAEEVRNLAMRSADAARDTNDLIETTVSQIDKGQAVAKTTNELFQEIVTLSETIALVIDKISHASKEQSQGLDQINGAMAQLDDLTQENSSNASELAQTMTRFRVDGESDDLLSLPES